MTCCLLHCGSPGTLLPSAKAASCPQLAEGDIRALAKRSGFVKGFG